MFKEIQSLKFLQAGTASIYDDAEHPNRMKFAGVLVRLDEPSTKAPEGSNGHRIMMSTEVAKRRLPTLIGMGLNYASQLTHHAQRHKVGVIEKAWIEGQDLHVSGTIWKHDFPEAIKDLKKSGLGMSMELGDVSVNSESDDIWKLRDFCFLGATILWKHSAAYYRTSAIAAKADERRTNMATKSKAPVTAIDIKKLVTMAAAAGAKAATDAIVPKLAEITANLTQIALRQDANDLAAAGAVVDDDEILAAGKCDCGMKDGKHAEGCGINAAKKVDDEDDEDEEDDEDMDAGKSAGGIDEGDLTDMGSGGSDDEEDVPGHLGSNTNKGSKTTPENKLGKTVSSARLEEALRVNRGMARELASLRLQANKHTKKLAAQGVQIKAATDQMNRRSVVPLDPQLTGLLAKAGVNAGEMQASGQKFTVDEVDVILAGVQGLDVITRMTLKNRFIQAGMMEQGAVTR